MINIGEGWFLFVCIHWRWVLYLLGDSGLHVNFQIIILARPNDVLWLDRKPLANKRSGNECPFITISRQTLRTIAPPKESKGPNEKERKEKNHKLIECPPPPTLTETIKAMQPWFPTHFDRRKDLKGNSSRPINLENLIYTSVYSASSISPSFLRIITHK